VSAQEQVDFNRSRLVVASSPHIATPLTVQRIMFDVLLALMPATAAALVFFGARAGMLIALCVGAAVGTEALIKRARGKPLSIGDMSAVVTGLLLALNLSPTVPWWLPVVGGVFAIAVGKEVFGGLGFNIFNPALVGRAFLLASFPVHMTTWLWPIGAGGWLSGFDATSTATPLALWKLQGISTPYLELFVGRVGGCLGETSALALLVGAGYLLLRGIIDWRIPLGYIGTVAVLTLVTGQDPVFHMMAGGLMLGAFFMATDYVTSPVTKKGRWVFAVGCGVLTVLIRYFGGYPEGVSYSILLMNLEVKQVA